MSETLGRYQGYAGFLPGGALRTRTRAPGRLDGLDVALICLFLIGLYTNYTIQITAKVPFPSVPSGVAGMILLWRRRDQMSARTLGCLIGVVALYLISILCATNITFLPRRTNGLIQLTYSLVLTYALFLTITQGTRRQVAALFLTFSLVILIGCLLESYAGFQPISDKVRSMLYSKGIYDNDLRDMLLYRRVRPKFFASEPASVTYCYTIFTFIWMVVSAWRWKLLAYLALVAAGLFAMPGPTLLLMLVLVLPYMMFLASRKAGRLQVDRLLGTAVAAAVLLGAFVVLVQVLFPERLEKIMSGDDPSFFYRVRGPAIAALDIMKTYPIAGAGLTGEPFIENQVTNLYVSSPFYSAGWQIVSPATELLINYFWLHWIYLGVVWGVIMVIAVTYWLRTLGVPSPAFCWMVWAIMGQAAGAYVGPAAWTVLLVSGAAALLNQREQAFDEGLRPVPATPLQRMSLQLLNQRDYHHLAATSGNRVGGAWSNTRRRDPEE